MAIQAKDGDSTESDYDFSKYLDLDDDDLIMDASDEDTDAYQTIPHSRDEVVTGGLELDLDGVLEGYIKAGKVAWGDKRSLRKLGNESRELEAALTETDDALLERTVSYHTIVSGILREKVDFGGYGLDDSDPYDTQAVGSNAKPSGSAEARAQSSEIFREIEKLESHRSELNSSRADVLTGIREIAAKHENGGWEPLDFVLDEKLDAISKIQAITKVQFSEEDEAVFEQGVGELKGYIDGSFDPLADEDEYGDGESLSAEAEEETPLSSDGHSDEEILAMEKVSNEEEANKSFTELFASDTEDGTESIAEDGAADEELETVQGEEFSSEESPEDLEEALGEGYVEAPEGSAESAGFDLAEVDDALGEYPEGYSDEESFSDSVATESSTASALGDDLSASETEVNEHSVEHDSLAETATWDDEGGNVGYSTEEFYADDAAVDEIVADALDEPNSEVPADEDSLEDETLDFGESQDQSWVQSEFTEDGTAEEEATEDDSLYVDLGEYSSSTPARAVIFEELKAKYGISFEGVSGLED